MRGGTWRSLENSRCECGTYARIRVHRKYREFLQLLEQRAGIEARPIDPVITYKCPWCQRIKEFTHDDLVGRHSMDDLTIGV